MAQSMYMAYTMHLVKTEEGGGPLGGTRRDRQSQRARKGRRLRRAGRRALYQGARGPEGPLRR